MSVQIPDCGREMTETEMGKLLYETPRAGKSRKVAVAVIFGVYIAIVVAWVLSGTFWQPSRMDAVLPSVLVLLILFVLFSSGALRLLDTPFKVYEKGVTEPLSEIMSAFRKEGRFVPYDDMEGFEVYGNDLRAILHLKQNKRVHFSSRNRESVRTLRKHLLEHKVREWLDTCQNCGRRVYTSVCPECGTIRA